MHNLLIFGSGRSGTSLAAGLFSKAGYYMGDDLYDPNPANPKGFFENREINHINEDILWQVMRRPPEGIVRRLFFRNVPGQNQMWLSRVPLGKRFACTDELKNRICKLVARAPFCFKDPRFSYTLPCWRPLIGNAKFLVAFRHPSDTAKSIAKECRDASYLHSLSISRKEILRVWYLMYSHIQQMYRPDGSWLFVHFDQMLQPQGLDRLERFSGAKLDRSFPERTLKRSVSSEAVPSEVTRLYNRLCDLADYPREADDRSASESDTHRLLARAFHIS
jgi:hypothetical protein